MTRALRRSAATTVRHSGTRGSGINSSVKLGVLPSPLWGGVGGGGRCYIAENVLEHAIDVRQHVVIPVSQHPVSVRCKGLCARLVGIGSTVLAAIDLNDDARRVTGKVSDVTTNSNLPAKMRAGCGQSVAEVPPELPFRFRRRRTHRTSEATLRGHDRSIALGPDSRLVVCRHGVALLLRPPPPAPPHRKSGLPDLRTHARNPGKPGFRGEGSTPSARQM
jgi:hypothetical protein